MSGDERHRARLASGLVALAGGLALVGSTFLAWITTPMQTGGHTSISGWGTISGGSDLVDGVNINTLMHGVDGAGSYRPAVAALVIGLVAVIPSLILAVTGAGLRPHRAVAIILALCGAAGLTWGIIKAVDPGDALGVLPGAEGSVGAGPFVAALGGLLILAPAALALFGMLDPPAPRPARRGAARG